MTKPFTQEELLQGLYRIAGGGLQRAIDEYETAEAQEKSPRLSRAIAAVQDRLDKELDEAKRERLRTLLSSLYIMLKWGHEYSEGELTEQLAILGRI